MEAVADMLYDLPKNYGVVFDVAHYIVCLQAERADIGPDFEKLSLNNPLASYVSAMMVCFAGPILINPLCGGSNSSPLQFLDDPLRVVIASVLWYLIYFSPNDFAYTLSKKLGAKVPLYVLKGLYYPKKIVAGIKHAKHTLDKRNWLAAIVVGTMKANGSGFIKPLARLVRGAPNITDGLESLNPSVTTKMCFSCACIYTLFPSDIAYISMAGLLVAMKVGPLFDFKTIDKSFHALDQKVMPLIFQRRNFNKVESKDE